MQIWSPENETFPYNKVYTPLKVSENNVNHAEIRLVFISAGATENPIECNLQLVKLGSSLNYEALSYCSGDYNDCRSIILNGHSFNTFRSTYEALRRFRLQDKSRVFWIDQICINQTDVEERDNQVLLMRDIYSHATRTQIWLGEAISDPPSKLGYDLMGEFLKGNRSALREHIQSIGTSQPLVMNTGNNLNNHQQFVYTGDSLRDYLHAEKNWFDYYNSVAKVITEERHKTARGNVILSQARAWFEAAAESIENLPKWHSLFELFRRPWWKRCWIVQEAVVSKNLNVVCGSESIAWEDVALFLNTWHITNQILGLEANKEHPFQSLELEATLNGCVTTLTGINAFRRSPIHATLQSHMRHHRESLSSDPRDKVYSMLGMLSEAERQMCGVKPSYTTSNTAADVYLAATRHILIELNDLGVLTEVSGHEDEIGLPSWVPNFSKPRLAPSLKHSEDFQSGTSQVAKPSILEDGRTLQLHGWLVDTIAVIGRVDHGSNGSQVLKNWKTLFMRGLNSQPDTFAMDNFYRAIGLDRWYPDQALVECIDEFEERWRVSMEEWCKNSSRSSLGLRFFVSNDGNPGLVTKNARVTDKIFIPWGSPMPIVIRRRNPGVHRVIGPCFLLGMMDHEVLIKQYSEGLQSQDVMLV